MRSVASRLIGPDATGRVQATLYEKLLDQGKIMLNTYLPIFDAQDSRALSDRATRHARDLRAVGERRRHRTRRAARRAAR